MIIKILKPLLLNRNIILMLGVVAGLAWGRGAFYTEPLILPVLALVMTIATMGIEGGEFRSLRTTFGPACAGTIMSYVLLSSIIIFLSHIFMVKNDLRTGFILIASAPPAVAVIPFSFLLRGNNTFSLLGTFGAYLGALIIMPFIAIIFFDTNFISPLKLITIIGELIFIPLAAGRFLRWLGTDSRFGYLKGPVTNWSFCLITYTIAGLNREMFFHEPLSLVPMTFIIIASTFLLGWLIDIICRKIMRIPVETRVSLVLLGTLKNYGMAGGLALTFFSGEAAAPSAVASIIMILYIIWLEWKFQKR